MTTGVHMRYRAGEPRESRVFPPMAVDHPLARGLCPVCGFILAGRDTQLLALGPDHDDPGNVADAREGRWYTAVAIPVHADCLTPTRGHSGGVDGT